MKFEGLKQSTPENSTSTALAILKSWLEAKVKARKERLSKKPRLSGVRSKLNSLKRKLSPQKNSIPDNLSSYLKTPEEQRDWAKFQGIIDQYKIKFNPNIRESSLRKYRGKLSSSLVNHFGRPTDSLKLIIAHQNGGLFEGVRLKPGYEFKIADLSKIQKVTLLLKEKTGQFSGDRSFTLDELLLEKRREGLKGSYSSEDLEKHYDSFRHFKVLSARASAVGNKFIPPHELVRLPHYKNNQPINIRRSEIMNNVKNDKLLGLKLPNMSCARYVSTLLGLKNPDQSSGSLASRLIKGGGRWVPEVKDLKPGDVVFWSGTYRDKSGSSGKKVRNWHRTSHIGVVTGINPNGDLSVRHQAGLKVGNSTLPVSGKKSNHYYQKHFYAGIRVPE